MPTLKLAIFGSGFWSRFQVAAWKELAGVEVVAVYNRTLSKAETLAHEFHIPRSYSDPIELLEVEQPDAVDVITDVSTHATLVELVTRHGIPVICQKPMASTLAEAEMMLELCQARDVPCIIHENWRWQTPLRQLKATLDAGTIGKPFRARIQYSNSFPVFDNQPFLKEVEHFIITDIGSHILDTARFLFGDAQQLYCQTSKVNPSIRGEDVATVMLRQGEVTCTCEMSYASKLEHEHFPETYVLIEGTQGSMELGPDYWIRTTTASGTTAHRYPPQHYPWADVAYDLIHSSIVPCNANILQDLQGGPVAETRIQDNIRTIRLVFDAYQSAQSGQAVQYT